MKTAKKTRRLWKHFHRRLGLSPELWVSSPGISFPFSAFGFPVKESAEIRNGALTVDIFHAAGLRQLRHRHAVSLQGSHSPVGKPAGPAGAFGAHRAYAAPARAQMEGFPEREGGECAGNFLSQPVMPVTCFQHSLDFIAVRKLSHGLICQGALKGLGLLDQLDDITDVGRTHPAHAKISAGVGFA